LDLWTGISENTFTDASGTSWKVNGGENLDMGWTF